MIGEKAKLESPEALTDYQKRLLENTGVRSVEILEELVEIMADPEAVEYFTAIIEEIKGVETVPQPEEILEEVGVPSTQEVEEILMGIRKTVDESGPLLSPEQVARLFDEKEYFRQVLKDLNQ